MACLEINRVKLTTFRCHSKVEEKNWIMLALSFQNIFINLQIYTVLHDTVKMGIVVNNKRFLEENDFLSLLEFEWFSSTVLSKLSLYLDCLLNWTT